jgi:hypothetical protein
MANHEIQSGNNSEDDKKLLMKLTAEQVHAKHEKPIFCSRLATTHKKILRGQNNSERSDSSSISF